VKIKQNELSEFVCTKCAEKELPFFDIDDEIFALTMLGKDSIGNAILPHLPSFSIQSLLNDISGEKSDEVDYILDITQSKYYTPSEFMKSKLSKDNFSMFHINIASLSAHLDELKMILNLLDHSFDIIAITETKIRENKEISINPSIDGYFFEQTPTKTDFGGAGLFIKNCYDGYKVRTDLSKSIATVTESIFI